LTICCHFQPGGELYFSDVYADRPVPEELRQNKILWGMNFLKRIFPLLFFLMVIGECLSGALCESDLISSALEIGFTQPILVTQDSISVSNKELEKLTGQSFLL
jgi:hypothetical protein